MSTNHEKITPYIIFFFYLLDHLTADFLRVLSACTRKIFYIEKRHKIILKCVLVLRICVQVLLFFINEGVLSNT